MTGAKINKRVFWKCPTSRAVVSAGTEEALTNGLEGGQCYYKEQGEAFTLADVLLIFTSPSGMTLIISS